MAGWPQADFYSHLINILCILVFERFSSMLCIYQLTAVVLLFQNTLKKKNKNTLQTVVRKVKIKKKKIFLDDYSIDDA